MTTERLTHTPGPWEVQWVTADYPSVVPHGYGSRLPDGFIHLPVPICRVGVGAGRGEGEALANARLIAAAPALYEACEAVLTVVFREPHVYHSPECRSSRYDSGPCRSNGYPAEPEPSSEPCALWRLRAAVLKAKGE